MAADLSHLDEVCAAMENVDAVVHMGGTPREDVWEKIHNNNIIGTYNVFEAARQNKVSRIVFASSNHVIGYYPRSRRLGIEEPLRPDTRYGVSKVFGEALGRLYSDKYGISVICQRIGSFFPKPKDLRMLSTWISYRDMVQLTRCCLDAKDINYGIVYGISANTRKWWSDPIAEKIGFQPQDNAEDYADDIVVDPNLEKEIEVVQTFQGGAYCGMEFSGNLEKIE
jgi:uronate dehydrogenase